ncbi:hypothetical protein VPHD148_0030 [Vibrio phage D148]
MITHKIYIPHHNTMVEFVQNLERLGVKFVMAGKAVIIRYDYSLLDSIWKRPDGTFIVATGYCPHEDRREWCMEQEMSNADLWEIDNVK